MGTLWHSYAKLHELIEMLFVVVSKVGQGMGILDGGPHPQGQAMVWDFCPLV